MSASNLAQFNKEIDTFARTVPDRAVMIQKRISMEALRRLVKKTPVKTGRARGNWQVTIGSPATGQLETVDPSGGGTIKQGLSVLASLPAYEIVWITNNVDYIEELEHGHSKQAPAGMLAVTVEELRGLFDKMVT